MSVNWLQYLLKKAPELKSISRRDFELSKLVMRVHRKKLCLRTDFVPMHRIEMIHCIDRGPSIRQVHKRTGALRRVKDQWLAAGKISKQMLVATIPSVSAIKVISIDERLIAFEGNGRLMAIQQAFRDAELELEVDIYEFGADAKVSRRFRRVQRLNGLSHD